MQWWKTTNILLRTFLIIVVHSVSSAPVFDYEDVPSPLSESESTITVLLRPALGRGAPVRYGFPPSSAPGYL